MPRKKDTKVTNPPNISGDEDKLALDVVDNMKDISSDEELDDAAEPTRANKWQVEVQKRLDDLKAMFIVKLQATSITAEHADALYLIHTNNIHDVPEQLKRMMLKVASINLKLGNKTIKLCNTIKQSLRDTNGTKQETKRGTEDFLSRHSPMNVYTRIELRSSTRTYHLGFWRRPNHIPRQRG